MDKNTFIEIFNLIQEKLPKEAKDLFLSFDGFTNNFNVVIEELKIILMEKINNNEFDDEYNTINEQLKMLYSFYKELEQINKQFLPEEEPLPQDDIIETEEDINPDDENLIDDKNDIIKYSRVHFIDEDFTEKTPAGFIWFNDEFVITPTWTNLYKRIFLKILNSNLSSFQNLKELLNKQKKYISYDGNGLYMPIKLEDGCYIEVNIPTSEMIQNIRTMFKEYIISFDKLKIYLKDEPLIDDSEDESYENAGLIQITTNGYSQSVKINYADYRVNQNEEHFLGEDFENKKVCGYILQNYGYKPVSTWANLYVDICNKLIEIDSAKFINLKNWFRGIRPYVSLDKTELRKARRLSNGIYLETNQSANHITSNIGKLLKYYYMPNYDLKIYLRADYSELHKQN